MFVSRPKRFYVNLARQRGLRLSSLLSIAVTDRPLLEQWILAQRPIGRDSRKADVARCRRLLL